VLGIGLRDICGTKVMAHLWLWEVIDTMSIGLVYRDTVNRELEVRCLGVSTTFDLEADV